MSRTNHRLDSGESFDEPDQFENMSYQPDAFQPSQDAYLAPSNQPASQTPVADTMKEVMVKVRDNFVLNLPRHKIDQLLVPIQQGILNRDSTFAVKDPGSGESVQINAGEFVDILEKNGIRTELKPRVPTVMQDYRHNPPWQPQQPKPQEGHYDEILAQQMLPRQPPPQRPPQVVIDLPVTTGAVKPPSAPLVTVPSSRSPTGGKNMKKYLIIGGIVLAVLLVIAIAVGLGVGLSGGKDDTPPAPTGPPVTGRILIFGGSSRSGTTDTIQSYSQNGGALNTTLSTHLLQSGYRGAIGVLGSTVVMKFTLTANEKATRKIQLFDPSNQQIRYATDAPNDYTDAAGAVFQNRFYLIGGSYKNFIQTDCNYLNSDFSSWSSCPRMPDSRFAHSVVALDDGLYLFGGLPLGENASPLKTVYKLRSNSGDWHQVSDIPTPAVLMGTTVYKDKIVVCGGALLHGNKSIPVNDCQSYESSTNTWSNMTSMNKPRWIFNLANYNDQLYALGGTTTGGVPDNSVEVYDDRSDKWVNIEPFRVARWGPLAVAV